MDERSRRRGPYEMSLYAAHHHVRMPSDVVAHDGHDPLADLLEGGSLLAILP